MIPADIIAPLIRSIRDRRVILDNDLAGIYSVLTKRLNEQYRRNLDRFPEDFAFKLTPDEWAALRSQIASLETDRGIRSQIATASKRNIRYLPVLLHDGALRDIYQKLRPLLEPPPSSPKPEIGFHVKENAVLYRTKRNTFRP